MPCRFNPFVFLLNVFLSLVGKPDHLLDWCPPSCPLHSHPFISQAQESQKQGIVISFGKTVVNVVFSLIGVLFTLNHSSLRLRNLKNKVLLYLLGRRLLMSSFHWLVSSFLSSSPWGISKQGTVVISFGKTVVNVVLSLIGVLLPVLFTLTHSSLFEESQKQGIAISFGKTVVNVVFSLIGVLLPVLFTLIHPSLRLWNLKN